MAIFMRDKLGQEIEGQPAAKKSAWDFPSDQDSLRQREYHELADDAWIEQDVTEKLAHNLDRLSELHSRMGFMMREVKSLMKI